VVATTEAFFTCSAARRALNPFHRAPLCSAARLALPRNVGRDTIRKAIENVEPRTATVFDPFRAIVDAIVAGDTNGPPKQRHTASQIYRRLITW